MNEEESTTVVRFVVRGTNPLAFALCTSAGSKKSAARYESSEILLPKSLDFRRLSTVVYATDRQTCCVVSGDF